MDKIRLLITGGCGFIGSNLISYIHKNKLLDNFEEIIIVDDLSTGKYIHNIHNNYFEKEQCKFSILNKNKLSKLFLKYKFTHCLHLAGLVSIYDCNKNPNHAIDVNIKGSMNVIELCKKYDCKIIAAESSAVYENSGTPPYNETQSNPVTIYSITKSTIANIIKSYHKLYDLQYNLLRFFNVAGYLQDYKRTVPALHCGFIIRMQQNNQPIIFGDGNRRRDFIHVDDVCNFIVYEMLLKNEFNNETFNLGTGKSTSLHEIHKMICEKYDIEYKSAIVLNEINGEAFDIFADMTKTRTITNWVAIKTMDDIISDTWSYIESEIENKNIKDNFMENMKLKINDIKI